MPPAPSRRHGLLIALLLVQIVPALPALGQVPSTPPPPPKVSRTTRLGFSGSLQTTVVSNSVYGPGVGKQANPNMGPPPASWYNFIPIFPGTGVSQLGRYTIKAWLSDDFEAGTTLAQYASFGETAVNQYWGVQAPWLVNPWNGRGALPPGVPPSMNPSFARLVNDRVWLEHVPTHTTLTYGSYHLKLMGDYLYNGQMNLAFNGGFTFPSWGLHLAGQLGGSTDRNPALGYEGFYAIIPDESAYKTRAAGGALQYRFGDGSSFVRVNGVYTWNENVAHDQGPLVPIPGVPTNPYEDGSYARPVPPNAWRDTRPQQTLTPREIEALTAALAGAQSTLDTPRASYIRAQSRAGAQVQENIERFQALLGQNRSALGFPRFHVGPQRELNLGIDAVLTLWRQPQLQLIGRYARSVYNPDATGKAFDTTAAGTLMTLGLQAVPLKGVTVLAQYARVDPTYDPFLLKYPSPPGVPASQPYIKFYPTYWQQHNYFAYANNLEGLKLVGTYTSPDERTRASVTWSQLYQVKADTPAQVTTVGNIDSQFPMLLGSTQKGRLPGFIADVQHRFEGSQLTIEAMYFTNNTSRRGPVFDSFNQPQFEYGLKAGYPIDDRVNLRLGYYHSHWPGNQGVIVTNMKQAVTHAGFDFTLSPSHTLSVDCRLVDMRDFVGTSSYNGNQLFVSSVITL